MLVTAAALLLAILPTAGPPVLTAGTVTVTVSRPPAAAAFEGVAYARVVDMGPPPEQPERFFMIDPIRPTGPSDETAGYY